MPAEAVERGPISVIKRTVRLARTVDGVLLAGAGIGLGVMVAAANDGFTITSQIDQEFTRQEQTGLIPPKPDDETLRTATNIRPTLEAAHIRPYYEHAVAMGERSVTIVFPDVVMERQAEFAVLEAARIRKNESITIKNELTDAPTFLGLRRDHQDGILVLSGLITVLCSILAISARVGLTGLRERKARLFPQSTPVPAR